MRPAGDCIARIAFRRAKCLQPGTNRRLKMMSWLLHRSENNVYDRPVTKFPRTPQWLERLYLTTPVYFVTCCAYRRRPIFANDAFHDAFVRFGERAGREFGITLGRYVIMPDHVHFFVSLAEEKTLGQWIGTLKRTVGVTIRARDSEDPIWQAGFFDHVMRSMRSYDQKWEYVRANPVRAGLVETEIDWPYAGEIAPLPYY